LTFINISQLLPPKYKAKISHQITDSVKPTILKYVEKKSFTDMKANFYAKVGFQFSFD